MALPLDEIGLPPAPKIHDAPASFNEPGVRALFYDGPNFQGKATRIFAWYGAPKVSPGEKVPAMVLIHGGGGTAFAHWVRLWNERGYAAISMDTCGCVPVGEYGNWQRHEKGGPNGWGGFEQMARDPKDHWTYHAVSAAILGHSLIRSFPEIDVERVGVTGISWGGYLTSIVASLDPRFKFAVPVYGCGRYDVVQFWHEVALSYGASNDQWNQWQTMWDPSLYLPRATVPFLWLNGTNDFAYWPDAWRASSRLPKSARTLSLLLRMPHAHPPGETPEEIRVYADSFCKGGEAMVKFSEPTLSGETLSAKYESSVAIAKAELLFTRDDFPWWSRRYWEAAPATIDLASKTIRGIVPSGAVAAQLNVTDQRGVSVSTEHVDVKKTPSKWRQVTRDVWLFRDSCNVYAVKGAEGMLIVDAGTGAWIDHVKDLPAKPVALACTHYFRDHAAGAVIAARKLGIPVYVPENEREIFEEPAEHFRRRSTYIIYDNLWNLNAPIEGVKVAGVLRDYETLKLAGLDVEVIPQPGATMGQVGLGINLSPEDPSGAKYLGVFCGETIHSPGRIPRVAPLQYNYNDLGGAVHVYYSAKVLRQKPIGALFPSLGEPMFANPLGAIDVLRKNLREIHDGRKTAVFKIDRIDEADEILKVTENVWCTNNGCAQSWYVRSKRSGKILAIDYGYPIWTVINWPMYATPLNRRAVLHSLSGLKKHLGTDQLDVVLVSHFHDDHVNAIPLLQRLQGTQCWAAENFADLLSNPEAHCFPCDWHQPIRIDRKLAIDKPFQWEEYTFHLHPMNGHTRFAALIGFEADGKRFAHTGDQYFFQPFSLDGPGDAPFAGKSIDQNHVYRNGALTDGFQISGEWMLKWRPDIVMTGHRPPMYTDADFFRIVGDFGKEYRELHEKIMPLGASDVHFNLDSWGGWIWPYRVGSPGTELEFAL